MNDQNIVPGKGPYSPDEREIVVAWIKAGVARNEIARRTGRGGQTVSTVAKQEGLSFVRDVMIPARAAQASDLAVRRLNLAAKAADKLDKLLDSLTGPLEVRRIARNGQTVLLKMKEPDPGGKRDIAIACGVLFQHIGAALKGDDPSNEGRGAVIEMVAVMRLHAAEDVAKGEVIDN